MSTSTVGRLVDENGTPWERFTVAIHDAGALFASELASAQTKNDGSFELRYIQDAFVSNFGRRTLEVVVQDAVCRELLRVPRDDIDDERLAFGELVIRRADATGFPVTLGTGSPAFLSQGNAVTLLMDKDAFEYASDLFTSANSSILLSQLFFALPEQFHTDATKEDVSMIFRFRPPEPTVQQPRAAGVGDDRPERILLNGADTGVEVRILLHAFRLPLFLRMLIGALTFPIAGSDGLFAVNDAIRDKLTDLDEVRRYFDGAGRTQIRAHDFPQPIASAGVLHAKLVIVDGKHALSIGSPFGQAYVDSHGHTIGDPRRGNSRGLPKHDASFGVSGPAVADLHATMKLLWNTAVPADTIQPIPAPPEQKQGGDAITSLQIVRTLTAGRLEGLEDGEKGILEAYQRAIANAQDFIYLETQYFTNDAIGDALVEALKSRPKLQVIVLVNIEPDVPTYPFKQRRLITRIRKAVGEIPVGQRPRFGVFTRWTHETGTPRPRILPVYVHAKVGIVDDTWATIGSANLDGLSLDSSLVSDIFHKFFGAREQRAIELNGVMLNGVGGQPPTDVVDLLRRRLWAEHLGYDVAPGVLDENHTDLQATKPHGWLGLWRDRADDKLRQLVNDPAKSQVGLAHVLPWPKPDSTFKTPRTYLNALEVRTHAIVPLKSTCPFRFECGDWKPGSAPAKDYP